MKIKVFTLCLVCDENKILLGMKKRGLGEGKWNGFGGKLMEGESIDGAAVRELKEEVGIRAKSLEKRAVLHFFREGKNERVEAHVFCVLDYEGKIVETEEMRPRWFGVDEIPFEEMWPDDELWIPWFLKGKKFRARFWFDRAEKKLLKHEMRESDGKW